MTIACDLAVAYAARGWAVFPLSPRSKEPLGRLAPHAAYSATTDAELVRSWFRAAPDANIAIACGAVSGFFVVDVDPRNAGDETLGGLEARFGALPETPRALTGGGGAHYLFALPRGTRLRGKLGVGIELKSTGGYIVAPPSVHPDTGRAYAWDAAADPDDTPIADAPDWLLDLARVPAVPVRPPASAPPPARTRGYVLAALARAVASVETAGNGERNNTLNREAWSVARFVLSGDLSEDLVRRAFVDAALVAGLPEREAQRTVESAMQGALRRAS